MAANFRDPNLWATIGQTLNQMAWAPVSQSADPTAPMKAYQEQQQAAQQKNATLEWLKQNNPDLAAMVASGMSPNDALSLAYKQKMEAAAPKQYPASVQEYQYAKDNGFTGTYMDWKNQQGGQQDEAGLSPVWGVDANGNPAIVQLRKSGKATQTELPAGFQVQKEPIKLDAGTHYVLLDPVTRQQIGMIPKDLAGAEQQKVIGKQQGENLQALPDALASAQQSLKTIDDAINHPGRSSATGLSGTVDPRNYIPGTDAYDFQQVNKKLQAQTFLEGYQKLRGAGQITEVEGLKAEQAITNLELAQSDEQYLKALNDLKTIITAGMERAKMRAGQTSNVQASPSTSGEVQDWSTYSPSK